MEQKHQVLIRFTALILILVFISVIMVSPFSTKKVPKSDNLALSSGNNVTITATNPPYHSLIRETAKKFNIDYRLIYSIIKVESRFQSDAVSGHGATGLMQVMPVASADINEDMTDEELSLPEGNINTGINYFASMMDLFKNAGSDDQIRLALAAYNAGPGRIYDAMELAAYIGENPMKWPAVRNVLPFLSKRYYSLHKSIWTDGKPRSGYFGNSRETVAYVDNVMKYYSQYCGEFRVTSNRSKLAE